MRFWLDKGVSGFRMDVTPLISKPTGMPDLTPEQLMARPSELAPTFGNFDCAEGREPSTPRIESRISPNMRWRSLISRCRSVRS
jgi:glycosidase